MESVSGAHFQWPPPQKTELSKNLSGFINIHPTVQWLVWKWFLCPSSELWEKWWCWLFSQVGIQTSFVLFFFDGSVSGAQEDGNECSLTTRNPNLLLEEMLKSDNPADVLLTKPDSNAIQKAQTPLPLAGNCISLVTLHSLRSGKSLWTHLQSSSD